MLKKSLILSLFLILTSSLASPMSMAWLYAQRNSMGISQVISGFFSAAKTALYHYFHRDCIHSVNQYKKIAEASIAALSEQLDRTQSLLLKQETDGLSRLQATDEARFQALIQNALPNKKR